MKQRKHDYELERYLIECGHDWEIVFGKYDSYLLSEAVEQDPRYFNWVISVNFPMEVIDIICSFLDIRSSDIYIESP